MAHLILSKSWKQPDEAESLALQLPEMNKGGGEDEDEVSDVEVDAAELEAQCNLPRSNRIRRLVVVDRAAARAERKEQEGSTVSVVSVYFYISTLWLLQQAYTIDTNQKYPSLPPPPTCIIHIYMPFPPHSQTLYLLSPPHLSYRPQRNEMKREEKNTLPN
jgi:hypothetical protein